MNGVSRRRGSRAWPGLGDLVKAEEPPHRTHTDARTHTSLTHTSSSALDATSKRGSKGAREPGSKGQRTGERVRTPGLKCESARCWGGVERGVERAKSTGDRGDPGNVGLGPLIWGVGCGQAAAGEVVRWRVGGGEIEDARDRREADDTRQQGEPGSPNGGREGQDRDKASQGPGGALYSTESIAKPGDGLCPPAQIGAAWRFGRRQLSSLPGAASLAARYVVRTLPLQFQFCSFQPAVPVCSVCGVCGVCSASAGGEPPSVGWPFDGFLLASCWPPVGLLPIAW
ncbi:hypothetical protein G7Z17_g11344 [Cylindrodendrum hubeiense]|uniref:Uncharacterized protein n=1 Tax=Cylindrodendrum hubeiense TaxID=595255 RepID=A0A9P5H0E3_9HYPO|nr:hypothetical protein G7Z17_g11344 [Cylindrodendrum hubeiense]